MKQTRWNYEKARDLFASPDFGKTLWVEIVRVEESPNTYPTGEELKYTFSAKRLEIHKNYAYVLDEHNVNHMIRLDKLTRVSWGYEDDFIHDYTGLDEGLERKISEAELLADDARYEDMGL